MTGIMAKKKSAGSDVEDAADRASEPNGEPANEGAPEAENAADKASEPNGEPANESSGNTPTNDTGAPSDAGATDQATPAEQDAYTRVVLAGLKIISDPKSHPQVMQTLQQGERPDTALADVTVSIITELDKQSQGQIPETVIIPASMEILSELGDVAQSAGVFEVDDATMTGAAQQTVLKLLQQYGIDPQAVQAAISKMDPAKVKQIVAQQQKSAQGWAGTTTDQADQSQPTQQSDQGGIMQQAGAQPQPA